MTRVATRVRAWTLTCQFVCSTVATLALAHPCALTGAAQRLGLSVYLVVALGSSVSLFARVQSFHGCGAHRVDLSALARSPKTHFYACVLVDAALLVAMLLLVGNTEDARNAETHDRTMKTSAFHRIEVAAFAGALGWGAHVAHCAIAYVVYTTVERNTVLVDVGGLYQPLIGRNEADVEAAAFEPREKATPASAAA